MPTANLYVKILATCILGLMLTPELDAQKLAYIIDSLETQSQEAHPLAKQCQILTDLGYYLNKAGEYEQALAYAQQAMDRSRPTQHLKGIADAYNVMGLVAYNQTHNQLSVSYFDSAYVYFQAIPDTSGIVAILHNRGRTYKLLGACEQAVSDLLQAAELVEARKRYKKLVTVKLNYALALMYCYQFNTAMAVAKAGIKDAEQHLPEYHPYFLHVLGYSYTQLEQLDEALAVLTEAVAVTDSVEDRYNYASQLCNLGYVYMELGQYEKAHRLFTKGQAIEQEFPAQLNRSISYLHLGILEDRRGNHPAAKQALLTGLRWMGDEEEIVALQEAYEVMARVYAAEGNADSAYQYLSQAMVWKDSVRQLRVQGRIQELDKQYQTERIERKLAETKLEMNQKHNRLLKLLGLTIGGGLTLFLVYLVVLISLKRKQAESARRQVELEYSVLRAQMNPHFIFNALNAIQGFFAERKFGEGNEYLGAFGMLIRRVLDQSAQASISLEEELDTLFLYLQLEQARLKSHLQFEIHIPDEIESSMIEIPPLIFQPFVENAIWHGIVPSSEPGRIDIYLDLDESNNQLHCRIEDNGVGLGTTHGNKKAPYHESKGVKITRERLGPHGQVSLVNRLDESGQVLGVCVRMLIPLQDD